MFVSGALLGSKALARITFIGAVAEALGNFHGVLIIKMFFFMQWAQLRITKSPKYGIS